MSDNPSMSCHVGHLLDIDVDLSSGVGTPSLLDASLPRTPTGARDTPGAPSTPGHHVSGLTHELRASLPSGPLTSWSVDDVSTCLRVLGRNFHNEGNATDVSVFDTAAESCGLDGTQLVGVTGDSLRALGFARYDHRASIMDWVRQHLELCEKLLPVALLLTRRGAPAPTVAVPHADQPREASVAMSPPRVRHRKLAVMEQLVSALARLSVVVVSPLPSPSPSDTSFFQQEEALSPVGAPATPASPAPTTPDAKDVTDAAQPVADEGLAQALVEANERAFQSSRDATEAQETALRALDEKNRVTRAFATYDALVPEIRTAHEALREDTQVSLARIQATFAETVSLVETAAKNTVAALEADNSYQVDRNAALLARNRALRRRALDAKGAIRVCVRVRPLTEAVAELDAKHGPCVHAASSKDPAAEGEELVCRPAGTETTKKANDTKESETRRPASFRAEEKRYQFDRVFGPRHTQDAVYSEISPLVTGALDGYSACVFAYGQTGSGKTHTMGCFDDGREDGATDDTAEARKGVNERALVELFELAETDADQKQFTIGVEMREIYNEKVRDLLVPLESGAGGWVGGASGARMADSKSAPESGHGKNKNKDLDEDEFAATRMVVRDVVHALEVMREGSSRRASAETALNKRSSRSHSVVTVYVEGTDVSSGAKVTSGRLHLVDLAGSERVSRSEAAGDHLKEAQHINKSLSALGDVVAALLEKRAHVPFRNSKLTRLLADSLGGDAKVALLAHLAPEHASMPETVSTLLFAQRCSRVELGRAKANAMSSKASAATMSAALEEARARAWSAKAENEALRAEIASLKASKEGASLVSDARDPLSPLASKNNVSAFASSLTPARPQSAAKAKRAIGRVASLASLTIMRES